MFVEMVRIRMIDKFIKVRIPENLFNKFFDKMEHSENGHLDRF